MTATLNVFRRCQHPRMFDVVIFIVAVVLVAGSAAAMHGFVRPVMDWIYPPPSPEPARPETEREAWLDIVRMRKRQRLAMHRELERDLQTARRRE